MKLPPPADASAVSKSAPSDGGGLSDRLPAAELRSRSWGPASPASLAEETAGQRARSLDVGASASRSALNPFEASRKQPLQALEHGAASGHVVAGGTRDESVAKAPGDVVAWLPPIPTVPDALGDSASEAYLAGAAGIDALRLSSRLDGSIRPGSSASAAQARLSASLLRQLDAIGEEVRDIKIFHFISHQDPHTVSDLRRAVMWVAGHPDGVGRVSSEGLDGRWPDEMDRLPKLAIALGLERLKLSGKLGMPTFEHEDTGLLLGQVRSHLEACLAHEQQLMPRLQERLMRALVGADELAPSGRLHALRLSVEELAARPRHNQRDYVAMAIELALDETRPSALV